MANFAFKRLIYPSKIRIAGYKSVMKELNLEFDEQEVLRIMEYNLNVLFNNIWKWFKNQLLLLFVLLLFGISIFSIGIEVHYQVLIEVGMALNITAFIVLIVVIFRFQSKRRGAKHQLVDPNEFITKYNRLEKVKYLYDNHKIVYLEEEIEQFTMSWDEVEDISNDENSIYINFKDFDRNIWIPKKMTLKVELNEFELHLKEINRTFSNREDS